VTFVFTDLEGSTRLLAEVGEERYAALLAEHHRVCRAVWDTGGGAEFGTAGDAFFVAFARADDAVAAAEAVQRELRALGLRVRIGIHTGEAALTATGYVGLDVHLAARIAEAAHGGQVVVSAATAAALAQPTDVELIDLGVHWFRDHRSPERILQVGGGTFPALKTVVRGRLPAPLTRLLGRERELADLRALLAAGGPRLTTLTGPGGTGKTHLAVEAARAVVEVYPGGVWWVPLAPVRDPRLALSAVAQAVGVAAPVDAPLVEAIAAGIGEHDALLLLDNAEHLMPGVASDIVSLLSAAAPLRVLVTSRERLGSAGERVVSVGPLANDAAVSLFVERAQALGVDVPHDAALAELCARLDGLPLAVELAAARSHVFTPGQLLGRLEERLDLLRAGPGAEARQSTLRAALDWSYELLEKPERRLLARLSVFAGGWTLEAATTVGEAAAPTLEALVTKCLVRRWIDVAGDPRYTMLETVSGYAAERLDAEPADREATSERHARWCLELVEDARRAMKGDARRARVADAELDNVNAALRWALAADRAELAADLVLASRWLWISRALVPDGLAWGRRALGLASELPPSDRAHLLHAVGELARFGGDLDLARALYEEELGLLAQLDGVETRLAWAHGSLAALGVAAGDLEAAAGHADAAVTLARAVGDPGETALALSFAGEVAFAAGRYGDARRIYLETVPVFTELDRRRERAGALWMSGECSLRLGELAPAAADLCAGLEGFVEIGERLALPACLQEVGVLVHQAVGDPVLACRLLAAGDRHRAELSTPAWLVDHARAAGDAVRCRLGDGAYADERRRGEALDLDEATTMALAALRALNKS
jgi:predicted ATPase